MCQLAAGRPTRLTAQERVTHAVSQTASISRLASLRAKPHNAHEYARLYPTDERLFEEGRKSSGCGRVAFRALQLCAAASNAVAINAMLGETLAYVREGNHREEASLTDLPSLLETIAAQFADIGHEVSYRGPDRLAFAGRAQAIGRAVANVVENATKFGSRADIILRALGDGAVEIEIIDDGPGIAPGLLDRVFEPFFKGDSARSIEGRTGFGLGLSIARDIVERHGGAIELVNREPHGLSVSMTFKPLPITRAWEVASAA